MIRTLRKAFMLSTFLIAAIAAPVLAGGPDPTGTTTAEANPSAPLNFAWTLIAGFLVFFMQAGFAMVEVGFSRKKNAVAVLTKNYMDALIGGLAFWAFGFAFMFGGSALAPGLEQGNSLIGLSGFLLAGNAYDVTTMELWFFQMVFAATAATIVSGAVAERTKVTAYLAYSFLISAIVYPIYGHWVWGGGWLANLPFGAGARDFAGSGVVHAVGGFVALAGAAMVGPRLGKYKPDGTPNTIPGHNLTFAALGTFILFFGWFGFNPGSTLAATDLRISVIAVNTFLAGAAASVAGVYYSLLKNGLIDLPLTLNAGLAGLVGITAGCAYVPSWAAVIIGIVSALVMIWALGFVERTLKVDDVVGAVSVHGFGGLWGLLAVGIFADGTYGGVSGLIVGETGQIIAQLINIVTVVVWSLGMGFLVFWVLKKTMGIRASRTEEIKGLDLTEHGMEAYPASAEQAEAA
ncbi:MAG TPA: ammonium transporter [Anaerolinea thermolimosa]|uniref:Ammonium transporter n=1 Tax=Anaerolinea thermolimosa TaxID=229919 RepID=A0A3D1JDB4_9CHLR|nr:ammonium transporter [Anaerolinea thermolimosa]